ncbi:hypothetical protein [Enterovirga sp. CN4-39]|uniref:hypothetical protein n=1 Tax=Enterovirga sp. CN4-39 TaxID=3400910 RepID=UPI003C0CC1EF
MASEGEGWPGPDEPARRFHVIDQPWSRFEDLPIDEPFPCGGFTFSAAEIIAFARRWDPQPFHVSEAAGRESIVGELFASAIHTFAASVGVFVRATRPLKLAVGLDLRSIDLPNPAVAEKPYRVMGRWVFARPSNSRPGLGIVRWEAETVSEAGGEVVIRFGSTIMVQGAGAAR